MTSTRKKKGKKGKKRGPQKLSLEEVEDSADQLIKKCSRLADVLRFARCTMVYTGAGISTSASIPDYRGPNGVWTKAEQGISNIESADPVHASPTYTHMALRELYKRGYIRHVLSQNCDGFHLRSGLPQAALSEVHGNMHVEVCKKCEPTRQYVRDYDVTEKTKFRSHRTGRRCDNCAGELHDTIVHFGEVGSLSWPLNWKGVTDVLQSGTCDVVLCLGTSLKILQKYKWLWSTHIHSTLRPRVYIVNLQATPKDKTSALKINGKCDEVMKKIMEQLKIQVPLYCRSCDPVLSSTRYRNSRHTQRFSKLTECNCKPTASSSAFTSDLSSDAWSSGSSAECIASIRRKAPGWWGAGLKSAQTKKRPKRRVGRPAKKTRLSKTSSLDECESGIATDISNPTTPQTDISNPTTPQTDISNPTTPQTDISNPLTPASPDMQESVAEDVICTVGYILDSVIHSLNYTSLL